MSNAWIDARQRRDEWPVRLVTGKDLPPSPEYPRHRIVVTAGLHQLGANLRPYFSVTCEVINKRKSGDRAIEEGGAAHELIAEHFPELAPVIALHLSDDEGVPMHAVENARYWAGRTQFKTADVRKAPDRGLERVDLPWLPYLASHLRIPEDAAAALARLDDDAAFVADIEAQRPRWQAEAAEAVALLLDLGATDNR